MSATDGVGQILTGLKQALKTYCVYDDSLRLTDVYEVAVEAPHGAKCLRTQYQYVGTTSRILKEKESVASWDSSWDM